MFLGHGGWEWLTQVAIPGIASGATAIALIVSIRTSIRQRADRRGIETIKAQRNLDATAAQISSEATVKDSVGVTEEVGIAVTAADGTVNPIRWRVLPGNARNTYSLENNSSTRTAVLTRAHDVTPGGDQAFRLIAELPVTIAPLSTVAFVLERSFASPPVTRVHLQWHEEGTTKAEEITLLV